jgi:ubiquinone/menaquinone biosynthesis C-methylase UbiE
MQMLNFEEDRQAIIRRYSERFKKYGVDVRTLSSGSEEKQNIRHQVHAAIGRMKGLSVLDIGCGFGDFYRYLIKHDERPSLYTGWDIVEPFIEVNARMFPEAGFEVRDALSLEHAAFEVDYVVMSQVFNNKYEHAENSEVVRKVLSESFRIARVGISVDMISSYVDYREDKLYYFSPEEMFGFAKTLTRFVTLRHDYLPFEFTMYLYKRSGRDHGTDISC